MAYYTQNPAFCIGQLIWQSRIKQNCPAPKPPSLFGNRSHLKIASGSAQDNPQAALDLDMLFEQKADQIIAYSKLYKPRRMKGTRDALYTRIT